MSDTRVNRGSITRRTPKVALVVPPFAPLGVPCLGVAALAAGLKARGLAVRTHYWTFRILRDFPGPDRGSSYRHLSSSTLWPFNEWIFAGCLYDGGEMAQREAKTRQTISTFLGKHRDTIFSLRDRAPEWTREMADELEPYDLIGVSSTFFQNIAALALLKEIKKRWPDKITVMGGANCDGEMGAALLEHFPQVDYGFGGEVDHSFPEFCARLARGEPVTGLPGLFYRDTDGAVRGESAPPVEDMDTLPIPDYDDLVAERERFGLADDGEFVLALESSRGCWWGAKSHCTFCGLNANGMAYRRKSTARFQAEVEEITRRYGARLLYMTDNIMSMDYYDEFMSWARQRGLGVNFFYEIKANVTRKQVKALREGGCTMVQPGIESFSTNLLNLMRKGVKGIQNVAFLKYARDNGVIPTYTILCAFPGEKPDDYRHMTDQLHKLTHLCAPESLGPIEFHRFSPYHRDPESFGIRLRPNQHYWHLYALPEQELSRIVYRFEPSDGPLETPQTYFSGLLRVFLRWKREYDAGECTLTWRTEGDEIVVRDRRSAFPRRDYRLQKHATHVFAALDAPRGVEAAVREADRLARGAKQEEPEGPNLLALRGRRPALVPVESTSTPAFCASTPPWRKPREAGSLGAFREEVIEFSRDAFAAEPRACLDWLADLGLLYFDDDRYLALPVAESAQPALFATWREARL